MSVFEEQAKFMLACGQTVGMMNDAQFELYFDLIGEEVGELSDAVMKGDKAEIFDALLDIIVVCIGAGHSAGLPMEEGWREVIRSNMAKVNPETGFVKMRADGKILKPEGWTPPRLAALIES
jgi:predicted HAD superfamily Cof-like phosphohydrolase